MALSNHYLFAFLFSYNIFLICIYIFCPYMAAQNQGPVNVVIVHQVNSKPCRWPHLTINRPIFHMGAGDFLKLTSSPTDGLIPPYLCLTST